jgi:hypothetical protein
MDSTELKPLYEASDFNAFVRKSSQDKTNTRTLDSLDTTSDLIGALIGIHESLLKDGELFMFVPTLDSINAKRDKQRWKPFEQKRLHFFSNETIQNLLCKCGFENIVLRRANDDGIYIACRRKEMMEKRVLSVIIPIYNEKSTALELLNTVYCKNLENFDLSKEIIIVESNSSDGTREIAKQFAEEHHDVKLILEDKPLGKGHAVRSGFNAATGDFITIQDGDLEYDINDYDKLLIPLVKFQKPFVLGSRHTGDWQMRKFGGEGSVFALILNVAHILFCALMNFVCGTKLKDPFTMFKLFRRECLYELRFDGNRFEIDWEIVIKFTRKGFMPVELPVNYNSRDFKEGKKIRIFKDGILCVIAAIKYGYLYKI